MFSRKSGIFSSGWAEEHRYHLGMRDPAGHSAWQPPLRRSSRLRQRRKDARTVKLRGMINRPPAKVFRITEAGWTGREGQLPDEISGDQKQRAAIARCQPEIIVRYTSPVPPWSAGSFGDSALGADGMTMAMPHEMVAQDVSAESSTWMGTDLRRGIPATDFRRPAEPKTRKGVYP
jgi:hypothetical protein